MCVGAVAGGGATRHGAVKVSAHMGVFALLQWHGDETRCFCFQINAWCHKSSSSQ